MNNGEKIDLKSVIKKGFDCNRSFRRVVIAMLVGRSKV
jgi:hypothetical protein